MADLGKEPIRVLKDVPGFVGNRMQHALQREAMDLVDQGIASPEDVDRVVKFGFGLRLALMGPLERADLGGLDITYQVQKYLLPFLCNETQPSPLLTRKVAAQRLGAKTGGGYFPRPEEKKRKAVGKETACSSKLLQLKVTYEIHAFPIYRKPSSPLASSHRPPPAHGPAPSVTATARTIIGPGASR
jgi:3-hydroxybutyryl-CoA dehydrogenase